MGFFDWLNNTNECVIDDSPKMRDTDFSNFNLITNYIYEKSGITDLDKRSLTASKLKQFALNEDIYTTNEFLIKMKNNNIFYQEILNIATVNETFFFRELKELTWLIQYIKSSSNQNIKILSMPCSSGEEIYSILLLMAQENIDLNKVQLTGYDINSQAVSHAIDGEYDEHSLHKLDSKSKELYFTKNTNNRYNISESFKRNTNFSVHNIFDLTNTQEKYDIVLSRNMFIYFDDKKRKLATDIIANLLKPDGIYLKGHADQIYNHPNLENIRYGVYKKI